MPPIEEVQPSLASQFLNPKTPGSTWFNLQVGSMLTSYASSNAWKGLGAGKGIHWSGIFGLRGIAAGQGAYPGRMTRMISPARPIGAAIEGIFGGQQRYIDTAVTSTRSGGQMLAGGTSRSGRTWQGAGKVLRDRFRAGGVFGAGGLLNQSGKSAWMNRLATALGGTDTVAATVVKDNIIFPRRWGLASARSGAMIEEGIRPHAFAAYKRAMGSVGSSKVSSFLTLIGRGKNARELKTIADFGGGMAKAATSNIKKRAAVRLAGSIGKAGNAALWLPLVFSATSAATRGLIDLGGSLAERAEAQLQQIGNRRMEFGGSASAGFLTAKSATERQRALAAIHQSGLQGRGLTGNEGAYQHQGNTW